MGDANSADREPLSDEHTRAGKKQRMLLTGKVALITGAGRGIGRAIALAFAGEGARTIVTGRNTHLLTQVVDEIRASGGAAEAFALDVTRSDDAGRVARQVIRTWGQIDALVTTPASSPMTPLFGPPRSTNGTR